MRSAGTGRTGARSSSTCSTGGTRWSLTRSVPAPTRLTLRCFVTTTQWEELAQDPEVQARLEQLYKDVDHVEWYAGIFAESYPDYMMIGELLTYMVANDAFTQALTNPLMARNVFNANTFTKTGLGIISETKRLQDIALRNSARQDAVYVNFEIPESA